MSRVDWLLASATSAAAGATADARALAPPPRPQGLPRPPPVSPEVLADLRQPLFVRPDGRAFRGAAARREAGCVPWSNSTCISCAEQHSAAVMGVCKDEAMVYKACINN